MFTRLIVLVAISLLPCGKYANAADFSWPDGHLLPTFSPPASNIDCIDLSSASNAEIDLFVSLEGIVNRTQPRIACVRDSAPEGKLTWLDLHHLNYQIIDGYTTLAKFKNEISGLVVTDPQQPETLNLATTLSGLNNELICSPALLATLTNAPYNLPIKDDLRGKFSDKYQVYDYLYKQCWSHCSHRIFAGLGPNMHGCLRDYLIATKSAVVWLNPKNSQDMAMLSKFFNDLKPVESIYLGWWPDESAGLKFAGHFGIPVFATDFFQNASIFSGVSESITIPSLPPPPVLQNKIYVSFLLSDGDNAQYMQHDMKRAWENSARGTVPLGWTVSPLCVDLDPALLNYYYHTATTNDCLVSGPSGAGYARLDFWTHDDLDNFTKISNPYFQRSGLKIVTIWLRATERIARSFANNCPSLLGLTSQDGGPFVSFHKNQPAIGLAKNYESSVPVLTSTINDAAAKWNGTKPMFIVVQANAWKLSLSDFRTIADSLDKNKFAVVRPDYLFELCRAAHQTAP